MTVGVLGIDACDSALARRWKCDNILLENHRTIRTHKLSRDVPLTSEIWPALATGEFPNVNSKNESIVEKVAKRFLSLQKRSKFGLKLKTSPDVGTTGSGVFENGILYDWPGITESPNWNRSTYWLRAMKNGAVSENDFRSRIKEVTGLGFGWLSSMSDERYPVVGTQVHGLDAAGHVWYDDGFKLRSMYEYVDRMVGTVRDEFDKFVIVSDHGMQTTMLTDDDPGNHSFRALVSSDGIDALPSDVLDFRGWLEKEIPSMTHDTWNDGASVPEDTLRDLGYLE